MEDKTNGPSEEKKTEWTETVGAMCVNEALQRKFDLLYNHFMTGEGTERLGIIVWRSRKGFPSDDEVRAGILQAAQKEIDAGIRTIVSPKRK